MLLKILSGWLRSKLNDESLIQLNGQLIDMTIIRVVYCLGADYSLSGWLGADTHHHSCDSIII